MKIYRYNDYIISEDEKNKIYFVAYDNKFYKLSNVQFNEIFNKAEMILIKSIQDNFFYMVLMISIIVLTIWIYLKNCNYALINLNFIQATLILIVNIFIHELGHIFCLKFFYNKSKIKVGFKFVFIYPAFYVDTSYSYLLPKYKRIAVYLAGNFTNCLFVLGVMYLYPKLLPYCYLVISNLLINFIPIVKSDGYYAYITFRGKTNKGMGRIKEKMDDFIRGTIMFILLSMLSYISNC